MQIKRITINNYRNIDGISVHLHPECSYIIGENNLGKSNFLNLLNILCSGKSFDDEDFFDSSKPILVEVTLRLEPGERGFFGDNFSPEDPSEINIRYIQNISDAFPSVICLDTEESLQVKQLRKTNFYYYESTAVPSKELRLDTKKGMGLLMSGIVERFIENRQPDSFLNEEQVSELQGYINEHLGKIQGLKTYKIGAAVSNDTADLLTRLFFMSDGNRKLDSTGAGVQYIAMASVSVICHIMELYRNKSIPFQDRVYLNDEGKRILPLILSIDEPEVHLHPYLQRTLIGFYKRILKNKDSDFLQLLKSCFDIDGLSGQIVIVTHSTDTLVGDYRNLVRFYKNHDTVQVISGASDQVHLTDANEKHLIMHFPEIKEAFYAHCVVLVEGETEYGCMNAFAEKLGVDLDALGICVLNARGENSIAPLRNLLKTFGIPSVAIYDGDVKDVAATGTEFFTNELCFEIELVKTLYAAGNAQMIIDIAKDLYPRVEKEIVNGDYLKKHYNKMKLDITQYTPCIVTELDVSDGETFCNVFSAWYMAKKGVLLGRIVGEIVPKELIPACYVDTLVKATEVAQNA